MREKLDIILSAKFGLILTMFMMPFVNISCSRMVNIPLSGMGLATGTMIEMQSPRGGKAKEKRIDAEPFASIALGAAIIGLFISFVKTKPARTANAIAGGAGAIFLLLLKNSIDKNVLKEGGGLISVDYEFGDWIALILFVLASVLSGYVLKTTSEAKIE